MTTSNFDRRGGIVALDYAGPLRPEDAAFRSRLPRRPALPATVIFAGGLTAVVCGVIALSLMSHVTSRRDHEPAWLRRLPTAAAPLAAVAGSACLFPVRRPGRQVHRLLAGAGLLLGLSTMSVVAFAPRITVCGEPASRIKCASNLRQIGLGIQMYAAANAGRLPARIEDVLLTQDLTPEVFVCAESDDTPARGSTKQQQAARLSSGGHLSYVYVGAGLTKPAPDVVIAFEAPGHHGAGGINVLFGDGRVELIDRVDEVELVRRADAGERPLVWPPRQATTRPATRTPAETQKGSR